MNAESKKIWSPSCRVLIDLSPFPQPYISCSFSDEIHDGVKDGLCASDILCRSGCSVWESLGHSAELTHLWYYPTTYSHLIRQKTHRSWSSGAHQYWFPPAAEKLHHRFDKGRWRNRRSDSTLDFHQNTSILSGGQKYTLQTNLKFSPQPWSLLVNVNMKHQSSHQCSQTPWWLCFVKDLKRKSFNECSAYRNHTPLRRGMRPFRGWE